jgi:PAS domain S-box-containing protein
MQAPESPARSGGRRSKKIDRPPLTRSTTGAREQLERSEEKFRALVRTAAAPILIVSPEFVVIEFNAEAERIYGRRRGRLIGRDYFEALVRKEQGGLTRAHLQDVLAGRPVRGVEERVLRPDGSERVLLWNASRLIDSDEQPLGLIAVAQDITERQQAEEALREREARLSSVISTAPDAIITIDERGIIQSFSNAAETLFGYAAGEVIGRNVSMLMPQPHSGKHDGYLARYRRTGEKRIIGIGRQVEAQRKDGTIFPTELSVGEVQLGATRIYTGFIRDITARAKMEQELRHAQKMEAIGQLTGGLAHDFNNLLTVITGNLEMLEERLTSADHLSLLTEAQEAADLGAKLAGRLLAFGRRQPLNPKPIKLSELAAGMADLLSRSLGELVRLETRLAPDLRTTMADPGQVENALLNLAINARDAMPEGGRLLIETSEIEIDEDALAVQAQVEPGPYAMLAVSDTGIGMTPEVRQRAFEPFFTTKGPGGGSGLGLSMVYGFVKQSGGHVQIYSELGHGTTVRMYLPIRDHDGRMATSQAPRASGAVGGEAVLVVEDDPRVRRVSVRRLKELGYTVIEVDSGPAALRVIDQGDPIDLVFTDVVMPGGMTGLDLAREVRRRQPELKFLFTSGYADPAMIEGGMLTANDGWLGKPYSRADLASKLRELLDHR